MLSIIIIKLTLERERDHPLIRINMDDNETYTRDRHAKQEYLKVEIVDKGYNTAEFAQFLVE